jgi:putative ABC transport system substrate-binding protein
MKRRESITLLGGVGAWVLALHAATAQPSDRMRRIAMLGGFAANDPEAQGRVAALQQGLKELGWTESRNLSIEFRWGTGGAAQIIVGMTTPVVAALVQETNTVPILFVNIVDPLGRGFVSNMARPGGNVTGFLNFEFSIGGKWIEILKEIDPRLVRIAVLFNPQTAAPYAPLYVRSVEAAAPQFGTAVIAATVQDASEIEPGRLLRLQNPLR